MNMTEIPFGMLFEEPVIELLEDPLAPEYDQLEELSYILDCTGQQLIPYVTRPGAVIGTQTGTKIQAEVTDPD